MTSHIQAPHRMKRRIAVKAAIAGALLLFAAAPAASQAAKGYSATPSLADRARISQVVVQYLASWNERDPARRRAMVDRVWASDGRYVDPNRSGAGAEEIDAMIAKAQGAYPAPYALRLVSSIETHNGYVRFSWAGGGMPDAPLYLAGTDFMTLAEDGRVQSVVGFADAAAVAPPSRP